VKSAEGFITAGKRRRNAAMLEPLGEESVAKVIAFRLVDGRIELDQDVAASPTCICTFLGAHDPGSRTAG